MRFKDTLFSVKETVHCGGRILDFSRPHVMAILNVTPDSFYDGGKYQDVRHMIERADRFIAEGADIIDIGGYSSRPGAPEISETEEKKRIRTALEPIRKKYPDILLSVDTFRSGIAEFVVREFGVNMINDISAGLLDDNMFETIGKLDVPYVMMHMSGKPATMQINPHYEDVVKELIAFFADRIATAREMGMKDILIDPGFGFGKTLDDNYLLLRDLKLFSILGLPVMVGISRKSMVYKVLKATPEEALNGTVVLHTIALLNGAHILRVHDVKEAVEAVTLVSRYQHVRSE